MRPRPYAATTALSAAAAVLATALATVVAAPAQALPPTTRTVKDATDPGAAYDITAVKLRSSSRSDRPAVVVVKHARKVASGDAIEVWFDFDGDKVPDLHVSGQSFSEFTVHIAKSFTKDGRDISGKDCARLSMAGRTSKIRLFPACVGSPLKFAVSVRSYQQDEATSTDDWAPKAQKFTRKVLAAPLT